MSRVAKRLKLNIPNVPAVYADEIEEPEWDWIKTNFPQEYKTAKLQIKEHATALEAQDQEDEKSEKKDSEEKVEAASSTDKPAASAAKGAPSKGGPGKEA